MKIPTWYRDKNGRYHRIPPGLFETFANGEVGFAWSRIIEIPEARDFLTKAIDSGSFRYEIGTDRLIFVRS